MDSKNRFTALMGAMLLALPWLAYLQFGFMSGLPAWIASSLALAVCLYNPSIIRFFGISLILAATVSAGIGLIQFMGYASMWSPWIADTVNQEAYGNLRQRNQQATLMALGLLALLCTFQTRLDANSMDRQSQRPQLVWSMPAAMCVIAWLALGSAMTSSRTGALAWILIIALIFLWRRQLSASVKKLALWAVVIYAALVVAMPGLAPLLGNNSMGLLGRMSDPNSFARIPLWQNVLELIAMKPWLGWGWGKLSYVHYTTTFESIRFGEMLDNAHNLPLHLAVELGVPVALIFCAFIGWLIMRGKPWQASSPVLMLAWGSLALIGFHSLLEYPLWYGPFMLASLFSLVVVFRSLKLSETRQWGWVGLRQISAALVFICTIYVAWDYHRVSQLYIHPDKRSNFYKVDPWSAAQKSKIFATHVQFAQFSVTPLERGNALQMARVAQQMVQWSPEPFVIEKLIQSAAMAGADDVAIFHLARYKAAYPNAYKAWADQQVASVPLKK
jgi:O-antigen ligase